ncbi:hypothetical protein NE237_021902 [Protea cynaroides]|uniref:Uncharacterized protein n=1 Tax=Protea cynaroides TaxID=273540 RepID=A0A9Q0HDE0_9MAGN|nr:hypothetical protein NE237_021902 [Protea cynaroides]
MGEVELIELANGDSSSLGRFLSGRLIDALTLDQQRNPIGGELLTARVTDYTFGVQFVGRTSMARRVSFADAWTFTSSGMDVQREQSMHLNMQIDRYVGSDQVQPGDRNRVMNRSTFGQSKRKRGRWSYVEKGKAQEPFVSFAAKHGQNGGPALARSG